MPETELMRAAELAQASREANWLFWVLMVGSLLIFAFWSLVRWRLKVLCDRQAAKAFRAAVARHELEEERRWRRICAVHKLPVPVVKQK